MPQIIVTADKTAEGGGRAVVFTERVSARDFESGHFQAQLIERIGWAVSDAQAVEQQPTGSGSHRQPPAGGAAPA